MIDTMKVRRRAYMRARARSRRWEGLMIGFAGLIGLAACSDNDDNSVHTDRDEGRRDVQGLVVQLHNAPPRSRCPIRWCTSHRSPDRRSTSRASFDQAALNEVRQDLIARGYTELKAPFTSKPTFVVLVGASATQNYKRVS